jgi:RND family efflux transporter MFP subunit
MTKKIILLSSALALVFLAGFTLYNNKAEIDAAASYTEEIDNVPVQVLTVQTRSLPQQYQFTGTFQPHREVSFGAEMQGKVVRSYVQEGQYLPQGKTIAKLDDSMLQLQLKSQLNQKDASEVNLASQKALLDKSQADLNRFEKLKADQAVADITYENQQLNHTQAENGYEATALNLKGLDIAIETTLKQIDKTVVKAPISGYLTMKQFEVGSMVAPNMPLGQITDISQLKLVAMVPEKQVVQLQVGQEVEIRADVYPGHVFTGTLSRLASKGDQNHHFKVEVLIDNQDEAHALKAGMYGSLHVQSREETESIFVPSTLLVGSSGQTQVYVIEDGQALLRHVKTGTSIGRPD